MHGISQLPLLEQNAIRLLIRGEGVPSEIVEQVNRIDSVVRDAGPAGVYIDFTLMKGAAPVEGRKDFHIADLSAPAEDSKGIEFILYVRGGFIAFLEVYSAFDVLPPYESVVDGFQGTPKAYE